MLEFCLRTLLVSNLELHIQQADMAVAFAPALARCPVVMGIRPDIGMGAIRFSLGRYTAIEDIDAVVDGLTDVLAAGTRLNAKPADLVEGTDRYSL
jgi:hypothetical protein